jgi:polysaccharide export outer membrane protein
VPRNDALKVFVMGDVVKSETQRIDRSGLTLAEALNNVGGINEKSADAAGIFVLRASREPGRVVDVFQLDASVGTMLVLSTQFELKPMDIVYVTSAPMSRWNKVISQLLPTINGLYLAEKANGG